MKFAYTVPEAAAMLSCSGRSVRRLVERGILRRAIGLPGLRIPHTELARVAGETR